MNELIENKIVLVTGGCGSIGSEIVRQVLEHNLPRSVFLIIVSKHYFKHHKCLGMTEYDFCWGTYVIVTG